jgi:hypothetical protein
MRIGMKKGFGGLLMLLGTFVGVNTYAQKPAVVISNEPGWHKIGEISADFKTDMESISVHGADEFTALKLKVTDASLNIERLQIFYESGDMEEINLRSQINENAESSVINLKHPDRDIQKVTFTYKTVPNAKEDKAEVELYGLKTNQPQGTDTYRKDRKDRDNDLDRAKDNTERDLKNAGDEVEREADEAGDDIRRETDEVGDDVRREANEAEAEINEETREAKEGLKKENSLKETVKDVESDLKDEKVEGKVSATGETVYITEDGKYYYIDHHRNKVFVTKEQLKDKPNK